MADPGIQHDLLAAFERRRAAAVAIAARAAAVLVGHRGRLTEVTRKGAVDLVTIADRESEALVIAELAAAFPGDRVIGEEGGGAGPADADFVWYVDPLDGTTNFVHGLPHFCVSLGVVFRGDPVVGVVHAPALVAPESPATPGIVWAAARGAGAARNGRPIRVSEVDDLGQALVATGFPYDRQGSAAELAARVERALRTCHCVRRLGSAALDLVQIADGTFSAYWEPRLKPWDLAAGVAIAREAGARVTDLSGGPLSLERGDVIATNDRLHARFLAQVIAA